MKRVAKLVIIDEHGKYLLLRRSGHPRFPNDPDLPGGTAEAGEDPIQTLLREVTEETGIVIDADSVGKQYQGSEYSIHQTMYYLYTARVAKRPDVAVSWEHASYDWLEFDDFLEQVRGAADTYMHMVYDVLK